MSINCYLDYAFWLFWQWWIGLTNLIFSTLLFRFFFWGLVGSLRVLGRAWQTSNPVTMCFQSSQESVRNADIANQKRVICAIFLGLTLTGVWCWMMANQGFRSEGSPFTILLAPQPLASTLWFMLAVLPRSILLLLSTKFVFSAVESLQVGRNTRFDKNLWMGDLLLSCNGDFSFWLVGLGATLNVAKPKKGSSIAIFGLGAVGLAVSFFIQVD